jgi:hypothetical protein
MENIPNEPIYSRQVLEFLAVAHEYCVFIEKCEAKDPTEIAGVLQKMSPLLCLKGSLLPTVEPLNPEANERFVIEEQWEQIFNNLRQKFGTNDEYWAFDPAEFGYDEPRKQSLAENFADVYQDLKDFTILYQKSSKAAKENAVSECKMLFETHWGTRLMNASLQLHFILFGHKKNPYSQTETIL